MPLLLIEINAKGDIVIKISKLPKTYLNSHFKEINKVNPSNLKIIYKLNLRKILKTM